MGEPGTEDWKVYVDNMLVLYEGDKVEEFAHQVRRLVEKLTEKGLKLKPAKCKVGYKKMRILGHLCEKGAASIDPEKVKCFSKMEQPKSLQALRSVLGFLNYVSDYVPIVADLLGPLRELVTRGNASGFWSLTVLPGGQGFLGRLGAPRDLFEFQVRGCSQGFLRGSFGRA